MIGVIHMYGCFFFFTICSCFGLLFVAFMDETRGKSLDFVDSKKEKNKLDENNDKELARFG